MTAAETRQDTSGGTEPAAVDQHARLAVRRLQGALGRAVDLLADDVFLGDVDPDLDPVYGVAVGVGESDQWMVPLGASVRQSSKLGGTIVLYRGVVHLLVSRGGEVREVHGMPDRVVEYLRRKFP